MRVWAGLCAALWLSACGASATSVDLDKCAASRCGGDVYVIDSIDFVTAGTDGIAPGFNIDGIVSDGEGNRDCFTADLVRADGTPGIDNQLASIMTSLPPQVFNILPEAIQTAINDGGLILLLEVVEQPGATDVALVARYGFDQPIIGTNDRYLPQQTFRLDNEPLLGIATEATLANQTLLTRPFNLDFRLNFLGTPVAFTFQHAQVEMDLADDGRVQGTVGGAVTIDDILGVIGLLGGDDTQLRETLKVVVPPFADIRSEATERCDQISAAVAFSGVPAFIHGD